MSASLIRLAGGPDLYLYGNGRLKSLSLRGVGQVDSVLPCDRSAANEIEQRGIDQWARLTEQGYVG